jgi:hypothetical protein
MEAEECNDQADPDNKQGTERAKDSESDDPDWPEEDDEAGDLEDAMVPLEFGRFARGGKFLV